jgi:hypothetical protein
MKNFIFNIACFCFKMINWNHFKIKTSDGKPYYNKIIKLKGLRTAVVENYYGQKSTCRFYWTIRIHLEI